MYEYRQIIYRLKQGQSDRAIAGEGLASRPKVKQIRHWAAQYDWLDPGAELPDAATLQSVFEGQKPLKQAPAAERYHDLISQWVHQGVQARVIHQHLVHDYGFEGHYTAVQRYVQKLKTAKRLEEQLTVPLAFQPGEAAQVDFGQGPELYDERYQQTMKTWFFVMTLCWSRHQYAELVTAQNVETWLNCHQHAFQWFNGVPSQLIIDNPKCAITKACYEAPEVQRSFEALAQEYGFVITTCPPSEPKKKGRVESGVKYVKNNFAPLRALTSLQKANQQLKTWVMETAGQRTHGTTFEQPLQRFHNLEQAQLKALPGTEPDIAVWQQVAVYRDCHIRYQKACYSVPHTCYGQTLWLKASPTTVTLYHEHQWVATHPRLFQAGEWSTQHHHLPPKARAYLQQTPEWCAQTSQTMGPSCQQVVETLLTDPVRNLLHQAQAVLKLASHYGSKRLDNACQRAIAFQAINATTVRAILQQNLDQEPLPGAQTMDELETAYQGQGRFQRDVSELIH